MVQWDRDQICRGSIENADDFASGVLEIVSSSAGNQLGSNLIRAAIADNALYYPSCWGATIESSYEMRA